jgi:hypothetical protein
VESNQRIFRIKKPIQIFYAASVAKFLNCGKQPKNIYAWLFIPEMIFRCGFAKEINARKIFSPQ